MIKLNITAEMVVNPETQEQGVLLWLDTKDAPEGKKRGEGIVTIIQKTLGKEELKAKGKKHERK